MKQYKNRWIEVLIVEDKHHILRVERRTKLFFLSI
jgi:hypothetical protein